MKELIIINNSGQNIDIVRPYFLAFVKTGVLHDDVSDLFDVKLMNGVTAGYAKTLIVDMAA